MTNTPRHWLTDEIGRVSDHDVQEVRDLEHMTACGYSHTEWTVDGVGRPRYRHVLVTGWRMQPSA